MLKVSDFEIGSNRYLTFWRLFKKTNESSINSLYGWSWKKTKKTTICWTLQHFTFYWLGFELENPFDRRGRHRRRHYFDFENCCSTRIFSLRSRLNRWLKLELSKWFVLTKKTVICSIDCRPSKEPCRVDKFSKILILIELLKDFRWNLEFPNNDQQGNRLFEPKPVLLRTESRSNPTERKTHFASRVKLRH